MNRLSIAIIILFLTSGLYGKAIIKNAELNSLLTAQEQLAEVFIDHYKEFQKNNKQATKKMKTCHSSFAKNQNRLTGYKNNNALINKKILSITEKWVVGHNLSEIKKLDGMLADAMYKVINDIKELRKLYSKTY